MSVTLVLGGARSGKSRHAEGLCSGPDCIYIATAQALDIEMRERIARHRAGRGPSWTTIEAPLALCEALQAHDRSGRFILVDCVTLWISNLMHAEADVEAAVSALVERLRSMQACVVIVSNEVGLSIVPENALARRFRDEAGRANQRLAEVADEVIFVVAGLPLRIKPPTR